MQLTIPLYIAQAKHGYTARPLFHAHAGRQDINLNRLLTRLNRDLTRQLEDHARASHHDELAKWVFNPDVTTHRHALSIHLKDRTVTAKYLLCAFTHLDRRIVMTPSVPDVWFELDRGEKMEDRAEVVYTEYWRKQERDADDSEVVNPAANGLSGQAWVQSLNLSIRTRWPKKVSDSKPFLFFLAESKPDGAHELTRVGRCLDWLYPDELERAILRDREVHELQQLLAHKDNRSVLMVGPRQCGKTTILHEVVRRRVVDRKPNRNAHENIWLIAPQRLISGMSYVGQWEARVLAILKHAAKREHILYFDDLLGLFFAGQTSQSSLNAAMVIKPFLDDRRVRVVGEITPEQLRVLQERDRGFADLFHLVPITEPNETDTLRIVIHQQRRLEHKHACRFELEAIPCVLDLTRRYEREVAFPGKACLVLQRLAVRISANQSSLIRYDRKDPFEQRPRITREDALADLAVRSGLTQQFLDPRVRLDRETILENLRKHMIGQTTAVEAVADVISVAKARLNDPERPLASFLFLGPTGVGKTECAKATARVLFGNDDRLLRFDLNEFNQPGSAARLVGTFAQPEGLLTSAIRRQPFAVILFDEIEKADRDVYDVLLQVLGEGRLTDALGRTANFTNAIIIMTSNLGVREAEGNLGFNSEQANSDVYRRAAERFFRPEFFNRIDRVIPFQKLTRSEMGTIAKKLVNDVLNREGFLQRQCVLVVSPSAIDRVMEAGYDPALGARAMKRAVEKQITQPAATKLAALDAAQLTIVTIDTNNQEIAVNLHQPGYATVLPSRTERSVTERMDDCYATLDRLDEWLATIRPRGPLSGTVTLDQQRYFAIKEQVDTLAAKLDFIQEQQANARLAKLEIGSMSSLGRRPRYTLFAMRYNYSRDHLMWPLRFVQSGQNMQQAIVDMFESGSAIEDDELNELDQQLALLRLMTRVPTDDRPTFLVIRSPIASATVNELGSFYLSSWNSELGVETKLIDANQQHLKAVLRIDGIHARSLANTERGTHLFLPHHGGLIPLQVDVVDDESQIESTPLKYEPIVRIYPENKPLVDIRTGTMMPRPWNPVAFRAFTLGVLPRV